MDSRSQFEDEKAVLLEKAVYALDQLHANLNSLQRNFETINAIGSQFEGPTHLWRSFHNALSEGTEADLDQQTQEQYESPQQQQYQVHIQPKKQRKRQRDTTTESDMRTRSTAFKPTTQ